MYCVRVSTRHRARHLLGGIWGRSERVLTRYLALHNHPYRGHALSPRTPESGTSCTLQRSRVGPRGQRVRPPSPRPARPSPSRDRWSSEYVLAIGQCCSTPYIGTVSLERTKNLTGYPITSWVPTMKCAERL